MNIPVPTSILKKTSAYSLAPVIPTLSPNKEAPGVPPYPPVELDSDDDDISDKVRKYLIFLHFNLNTNLKENL